MKKIIMIFVGGILPFVTACDLQPKITSLPDSVGEFISARYPALLADPNTNPEIYNSAATDYGVYASPELYGTETSDDYVTYASVNDYIMPPASDDVAVIPVSDVVVTTTDAPVTDDYINVPMYGSSTTKTDSESVTVAAGDTLYSIARHYGTNVQTLAKMNKLSEPYALSVGQRLSVPKTVTVVTDAPLVVPARTAVSVKPAVQTKTRVELKEITITPGDTLYSLSRRYSVPVNDLAVMNKLSAPFALSVGQKLKVPDLSENNAKVVATTSVAVASTSPVKSATQNVAKSETTVAVKPQTQKISSDPNKKLPKLTARSSSKFTWPVRGKILSNYGAKKGGLFNDGINISATRGATVGAAENGVVAYAGNEVKGMGNLVIVQHDGGWMTVYAHMDSMAVRRGTRVTVGQKVGTVGSTGKVDTPQLHFEIRKGTKAYNPSSYLKK